MLSDLILDDTIYLKLQDLLARLQKAQEEIKAIRLDVKGLTEFIINESERARSKQEESKNDMAS